MIIKQKPMRYKLSHPLISEEFASYIGSQIEIAVDFENERERYIRRSVYNEQETHRKKYTIKQVWEMRFGQI